MGEIGEIAEHIKKNQFQNQPLDLQAFSLDLGDCLWYLTTLAHISGFTLEQIADNNVHKLKTRYPDKFQ
ncbi:hypothetical protein CON35_31830 [Bacillus cereus]|nr:hypothetical protein CON35_31830 [Bacillus cereus]